jgi:hypothetical protein
MPSIHLIIDAIPQDCITKVNPEAVAMFAFRRLNTERAREVFERKEKAKQGFRSGDRKTTTQHTVFDDLLDNRKFRESSDPPPTEMS